jgi:tetratricopeptide (TPR) repeat protein
VIRTSRTLHALGRVLLAAALAAAPGCGGKLGDKKTTPSSKGTVVTEKTGDKTDKAGDKDDAAGGPGAGPGASAGKDGKGKGKGKSARPGDEPDDDLDRPARKRKRAGKPDDKNDADVTDVGDIGDPYASSKSKDTAAGKSSGTADGKGAGSAAERKPAPPRIKPPDLDLPAADQARRVESQLTMGRRALGMTPPDPDRAIEAARAALEIDTTSIDAVAVMAHAYHAKGFQDTAEVMLDMLYRERERARQSPAVFFVYGLVYDATDRPERALAAYYQAVQIEPAHQGALTNLGAHYLRKKMFAEATLIFEKLSGELGVRSAVVWTNLGSAYRGRASDYPVGMPNRDAFLREAETAFKRAMSHDRNYANIYYNLGLLYLDADPFPGPSGPMDTLQRLGQARTYFEEYGRQRGADRDLMNERIKDVDKLIKREKKRQKRGAGDDW